ncbi:hypothetical protein [Polaromonas sp. SM01]|uniref:hypothetical protein n=1 Tax=Polaromonas sp. SM01 TaxID=3085630 RepID=UPI00298216C2|nr:hypothetical protein [Polaromonas sp. SM01]MDW5441667.1 hypothetical protein [Polaromonas sp. SM01]
MITSSDAEYKATRQIKRGIAQLVAPFDELAAWIGDKWAVTVLNVIYDPCNELHAPRLQVVLEHQKDSESFRDGFNFDHEKQRAIALRFMGMITRQSVHRYDVEGLFVVFSAFSPIARQDADSKIPDQEIEALKLRIANPDLWTISRFFAHPTFMFYTDAQAKAYAVAGKREAYAHQYFKILKQYDEFGYISEDGFAVQFDSKQNFDENYKSNWYNYYR